MQKRAVFPNKVLPYLLVAPQIAITVVFFFWPASQAILQSVMVEDPFGLSSRFVWFENFEIIFDNPDYINSLLVTAFFSGSVSLLSLTGGMFLALQADRVIKGAVVYNTMLVWPYAIASAVAGVLWLFLFNPTLGIVAFLLRQFGYDWNHLLNGGEAMGLVILASTWHRIPYNFLFFLAGLQSIPRGVIEASAIDGAGRVQRFWKVIFPLLMPTTFFLVVVNIVYSFFETFGVIHQVTEGGPAKATEIMVYKVYYDGFVGLDLGGSAAQSVVLMAIVIGLTVVQFRYIESRVYYE
jgi:sn-glycerol 3-phosphate transport system permease protein